jgi:hypothetical protein
MWNARIASAIASLLIVASAVILSAGPALVLSAINERDANGDAHAFELYGDFPDNADVRPIVFCNGALMQAETHGRAAAESNQRERRSDGCGLDVQFALERLTTGFAAERCPL